MITSPLKPSICDLDPVLGRKIDIEGSLKNTEQNEMKWNGKGQNMEVKFNLTATKYTRTVLAIIIISVQEI